jgi:REP element-mobilizing transposase RayT
VGNSVKYDPEKHRRRSIRLREYDYTQARAYFVTVCSHKQRCIFGRVVDGEMLWTELGRVIAACWNEIPHHFLNARLDASVLMPNHVHAIIVIAREAVRARDNVGATHASPLRPRGPKRQSVAAIAGSFKSASTKRINQMRGTPGLPLWQRNYHEHVVRNEHGMKRIREYILTNPVGWTLDPENPDRRGEEDEFDRWLASLSSLASDVTAADLERRCTPAAESQTDARAQYMQDSEGGNR